VRLLQRRNYSAGAASNGSGSSGGDKSGEDDRHPIRRTLRLLGNDMRKVKDFFVPKETETEEDRIPTQSKFQFTGEQTRDPTVPDDFQTHCDVLIIGGGGVGSSIAYWLKEKARDGLNVVVVEKDDTVSEAFNACINISLTFLLLTVRPVCHPRFCGRSLPAVFPARKHPNVSLCR